MTAIIYFGEMLVAILDRNRPASNFATQTGADGVLFVGGIVALTLAEYLVHRFVLHGFAPTPALRAGNRKPAGAFIFDG